MAIRNIIFDLGGVFIDIEYQRTRAAFEAAGVINFDQYYHQSFSNPLFADLERGQIAPGDFYRRLREETGVSMTDDTIRDAWNALLGHYRRRSIDLLPALQPHYRIFLLSNTNQIHYEAFSEMYNRISGGMDFDAFFEQAHYSHILGLRKPDLECYQKLITLHNLEPGETLFVDDTFKNIEGAAAAGLQTLWLNDGRLLEEALPGVPGLDRRLL